MNVSLTPELERFVLEKLESGIYSTSSEVVREALRLLRSKEPAREARLGRSQPGRSRPAHTATSDRTPMVGLSELKAQHGEIAHIAETYGAGNVRIFGPLARQEAASATDIDFLVDMEPDRSLLDRAGLRLDLEGLLGCRVNVVTQANLSPRARPSLLQDALPL